MTTKKNITRIGLLIIVLVCLLSLSACGIFSSANDNSGTGKTIDITFSFHDFNKYISGGQEIEYKTTDFFDSKSNTIKAPAVNPTSYSSYTADKYVFEGWYLDSAYTRELEVGTKITQNTTLHIYAHWVRKQYTITVYDEFNETQEIKVNAGDTVNLSDALTDGYTFAGWYTNEARTIEFDETTVIYSNYSLYAKWVQASLTITYETNGGTINDSSYSTTYTIDTASSVTLPSDLTKEHYSFDGWYLTSDFSTPKLTNLVGNKKNVTLYAKYICHLATLYNKQGLSTLAGVNGEMIVPYGGNTYSLLTYFDVAQNATIEITSIDPNVTHTDDTITLSVNTSETDSKEYIVSITVTAEDGVVKDYYTITITQLSQGQKTLTYVANGDTKATDQYESGELTSDTNAPDVSGDAPDYYEFSHWSETIGGTAYTFGTAITDNITLYAVYTPIEYTVTYSIGGATITGSSYDTTYTVEDYKITFPTLSYTGYTLDAWYDSASYTHSITSLEGKHDDIIVYARFEKDNAFTIVLEENGTYNITEDDFNLYYNMMVLNQVASIKLNVSNCTETSGSEEYDYITNPTNNFYKLYVPFTNIQYGITSYLMEGNVFKCTLSVSGYNDIVAASMFDQPASTAAGATEAIGENEWISTVNARGNEYGDFAIDHINTKMSVSTSSQLYWAIENGYNVDCVTSSRAATLYNTMRTILNSIISDGMTEEDKVIAMCEWITNNVKYDFYVYNLYVEAVNTHNSQAQKEIAKYDCFHLEGVFIDGYAVCEGISKALACLCNIEGISCKLVSGTLSDGNHAWNKVFLDLDMNGTYEWYAVDCTNMDMHVPQNTIKLESLTHAKLFLTDEELSHMDYVLSAEDSTRYLATTEYNAYQMRVFRYGENDCSLIITTTEQLTTLLRYFKEKIIKTTPGYYVIDFVSDSTTMGNLSSAMGSAGLSSVSTSQTRDDGFYKYYTCIYKVTE